MFHISAAMSIRRSRSVPPAVKALLDEQYKLPESEWVDMGRTKQNKPRFGKHKCDVCPEESVKRESTEMWTHVQSRKHLKMVPTDKERYAQYLRSGDSKVKTNDKSMETKNDVLTKNSLWHRTRQQRESLLATTLSMSTRLEC